MSRWRVKAARSTVHNAALWWEAYDSEGKDWEAFRTHAEALAYADQQARTVEVTLPPVVEHPSDDVPGPAWHMPGEFVRHWISTSDRSVWMTDIRGLGDLMDADVAERRALALLAAAKHAKGELA